MNPRRLIGISLVFALVAGQMVAPVAGAACATPRATAKAACPGCAGGQSPAAASVKADRSCCAAPQSLAEREPATVKSDRSGEPRVLYVLIPVPSARVLVAWSADPAARASRAGPPGSSQPHLRTTVLLI